MGSILPLLTARSVEEAHLYMDLRGGDRQGREHALVSRDGALVSTYRCLCGGAPREFHFDIPNPTASGLYGGDAPSTLIDPGEFLDRADAFARQNRLPEAAACLDEVLKFIPAGADAVPASAFRSETGRALYDHESGRFTRSRLVAVAETYRARTES